MLSVESVYHCNTVGQWRLCCQHVLWTCKPVNNTYYVMVECLMIDCSNGRIVDSSYVRMS